jgi:hypothetical protein
MTTRGEVALLYPLGIHPSCPILLIRDRFSGYLAHMSPMDLTLARFIHVGLEG